MEYRQIQAIAPFLRELGFTHVQFPPIQPTRSLSLLDTDLLLKQVRLRDNQLESFGTLCRTAREKSVQFAPHTFDHLLRQRIYYIRQPTLRDVHALMLESGITDVNHLLAYMYEYTPYGDQMVRFFTTKPTKRRPLERAAEILLELSDSVIQPDSHTLEQVAHNYQAFVTEMKRCRGVMSEAEKQVGRQLKLQHTRLLQQTKQRDKRAAQLAEIERLVKESSVVSEESESKGATGRPPFDLQKARQWLDCVTLLEYVLFPPWWLIYQPLGLDIGDTFLGTKRDILDAVETCRRYELSIIADVVINNLAAVGGEKGVWTPYLRMASPRVARTLADILPLDAEANPAVQKTKQLLLRALGSTDLQMLTVPWDCGDAEDPTRCWMSGALPQLQQGHPVVRAHVDRFMKILRSVGISGVRVDAATHLTPSACLAAVHNFYGVTSHISEKRGGISYIEYVGNHGSAYADVGLRLEDFGIGEDLYLRIFSELVETERLKNYGRDRLQRLEAPDSVVMIINHDHIMGSLPSKIFTELPSKMTYELSLAYLLQRVYGHVLVLPHDIEFPHVQKALDFRRRMREKGIVREYVHSNGDGYIEIEKYDDQDRCLFVVAINLNQKTISTSYGVVEPVSITFFDIVPAHTNINCVYSNTQNHWMRKYCYPRGQERVGKRKGTRRILKCPVKN